MDIIHPKQQAETVESHVSDTIDFNAVRPETIEAMKYLGLTQSLYDEEVMSKIDEIVDFTGTGDLMPIDTKLGNPYGMNKLDKIYSYIRLMKQSVDLQQREAMLEQERQKYNAIS